MTDLAENESPVKLNAQERAQLREEIKELCAIFGNEYWRELDISREYPHEFVDALTKSRYLSVLIPKKYGGIGYGLTEASIILEEIHCSGGSCSSLSCPNVYDGVFA